MVLVQAAGEPDAAMHPPARWLAGLDWAEWGLAERLLGSFPPACDLRLIVLDVRVELLESDE